MVLSEKKRVWCILRILLALTSLFVVLCYVRLLPSDKTEIYPHQQRIVSRHLKQISQNHLQSKAYTINDNSLLKKPLQPACVRPELELWNPSLRMFFKEPEPPLQCDNEENWVFVENGTFRITQTALRIHGDIHCLYWPHFRIDDWGESTGKVVEDKTDGSPLESDAFNVHCGSASNSHYSNIHLGVAYSEATHRQVSKMPDDAMGLDVLIIGFDSMSQMNWRRNLPQTHKYFVNVLGGVVLDKLNIVGDGTAQFLFPMLAGYHPEELPEARKGILSAKPLDTHPWIWKELKQAGYITQFAEDETRLGTFTYRYLGFKEQPSDHYGRNFWHIAEGQYRYHPKLCLGSNPRHVVMLNYIQDFFDMYQNKPKWSFSFHTALSHYYGSKISTADQDLSAFLESLQDDKYRNTLVILMGDHGMRFNEARQTMQGKYEERLPYFGLVFPSWFKDKYPAAYANIKINAHRLTTPFDVHKTFLHILNYTGSKMGDLSQRAISLFDEVPLERTCSDAGIANHWCVCLNWKNASLTDNNVLASAKEILTTINRITSSRRRLCAKLKVKEIRSASMFVPKPELVHFKTQVNDVPIFTEGTPAKELFYQVTMITSPGDGMFEATVRLSSTESSVSEKEISRINKYGEHPHCVQARLPHLHKYCYCRQQRKAA